ncbi:NAD(P)-binding protein [Glonium stellatum]|uniref:NAD(P)-binding protein n=1 Tax=Glonium stellatum TaxID=574774 RepID=A0A8E2F998_9PEZI|nr:NAD(P)-binding protein [Glonium stellatum]
MTTYHVNDEDLSSLQGKTILIIGAATGIGRAAVDIAHEHGANIAIGDWNEEIGAAVAKQIGDRAIFYKCDVSKWDDVLELFHQTFLKFGIIHSVISNAGINTHETFLEDEYDKERGTLLPPDLKSIEVNLLGQLYVTKCALHYFKKWPKTQCQIVMTASAGAFFPAPPIYLYCTAKSGVLGLMRGLRSEVIKGNATVNVVAPWLTVTPMLLPEWNIKWGNLPKNSSAGVARALLLPVVHPQINGKAFFVAGNIIVDLEDSLHEAQPAWMGKELSDNVRHGQKLLLGEE